MSLSTHPCPRCGTADTIRTDDRIDSTSWYCYACRRIFDVPNADDPCKNSWLEKERSGTSDRRR
jgi:hypothetical protein